MKTTSIVWLVTYLDVLGDTCTTAFEHYADAREYADFLGATVEPLGLHHTPIRQVTR